MPVNRVRADDVRRIALDDRLLVGVDRARFFGRNEGRPDIGEIGPHGLGRKNGVARRDRPRKKERPFEPGADVVNERERRGRPGVAAGAGCDRNEAVGALLDRLQRETVVDDVVQRDPAIGMHSGIDVGARAERRDDDRRLPFDGELQVLLEFGRWICARSG